MQGSGGHLGLHNEFVMHNDSSCIKMLQLSPGFCKTEEQTCTSTGRILQDSFRTLAECISELVSNKKSSALPPPRAGSKCYTQTSLHQPHNEHRNNLSFNEELQNLDDVHYLLKFLKFLYLLLSLGCTYICTQCINFSAMCLNFLVLFVFYLLFNLQRFLRLCSSHLLQCNLIFTLSHQQNTLIRFCFRRSNNTLKFITHESFKIFRYIFHYHIVNRYSTSYPMHNSNHRSKQVATITSKISSIGRFNILSLSKLCLIWRHSYQIAMPFSQNCKQTAENIQLCGRIPTALVYLNEIQTFISETCTQMLTSFKHVNARLPSRSLSDWSRGFLIVFFLCPVLCSGQSSSNLATSSDDGGHFASAATVGCLRNACQVTSSSDTDPQSWACSDYYVDGSDQVNEDVGASGGWVGSNIPWKGDAGRTAGTKKKDRNINRKGAGKGGSPKINKRGISKDFEKSDCALRSYPDVHFITGQENLNEEFKDDDFYQDDNYYYTSDDFANVPSSSYPRVANRRNRGNKGYDRNFDNRRTNGFGQRYLLPEPAEPVRSRPDEPPSSGGGRRRISPGVVTSSNPRSGQSRLPKRGGKLKLVHSDTDRALVSVKEITCRPEGVKLASVEQICDEDLRHFAHLVKKIGGEDKHQFWTTIHQCTGKLPVNKPRYCMGVGFAPDLVVCVALGVDMFDCVYPTRTARFGCALIETGQFSLKSTKYAEDFSPLDATCLCDTCKHYTRAYIHAAMVTKNTIGCHLLSVHNIAYLTRLMRDIRESVKNDSFSEFVNDFFQKYYKDSVPKWIVDALAAVNIIVTKSEWSVSSATGDCTSESSPVYAVGQDYEQASTTQEFLQSPMDLKTVSSTNVRPDRKASSEHDIEDHNNVVLVKMDEVHVTEEKGNLNDSNDWLDIDNVEGNDSYVRDQIVSEFETRSYDQGFRDTLRMDHPDEEERGRAAGFVNAFNFALSDDGQEDDASKARALKSKGVQPQKLPASCCQVALSQKNDHSSVTNLTHRLSILDGSLSLMLLKYQTVMTDEHLREVVSVKESIKNELEKADLKYEFSIERSLTLRFSKPCDDLESKLISVHNASDAQQCECKSQGNKCITERSSSGTTSSKSDSDATDDQITCDTLYTVSHTGHSDSNFSENCSLTARELISRANKVCSQLNWKIPLA